MSEHGITIIVHDWQGWVCLLLIVGCAIGVIYAAYREGREDERFEQYMREGTTREEGPQ